MEGRALPPLQQQPALCGRRPRLIEPCAFRKSKQAPSLKLLRWRLVLLLLLLLLLLTAAAAAAAAAAPSSQRQASTTPSN